MRGLVGSLIATAWDPSPPMMPLDVQGIVNEGQLK